MKTLQYFNQFVKEINESNSRLYKQSVLKKYKGSEIIQQYLQIAFDPYKVYGISTKKLSKIVGGYGDCWVNSVFDLFEYLEEHNTGADKDISICQEVLNNVSTYDREAGELLRALICKDLSIGCDAKTINKEIPDCIPTFNVQLANKYFDKPEYVEGKKFAITTKIDGGRIIALKENGQVSFYTRAGQKYEGLVDLEEEMMRLMPDHICLDGEITLLVRGNLSSKEAYKETMKIVRTKDKEKHGIKMLVFDAMPVSDFKTQTSSMTYIQRRQMLDCMSAFAYDGARYFELLPILYRGSDTSKITEILEEEVANGEEGIMINICDAPYSFKRTNDLLKVKKMQTMDLEIIGFEEGEGRLSGKLGAILVRYKNGNVVKVGSGFSDDLRVTIWNNQSDYLGAICEIQYFEETTNADGGESLRFPIFKDFRPDKLTPDF
jgi:DNA ligase-1